MAHQTIVPIWVGGHVPPCLNLYKQPLVRFRMIIVAGCGRKLLILSGIYWLVAAFSLYQGRVRSQGYLQNQIYKPNIQSNMLKIQQDLVFSVQLQFK